MSAGILFEGDEECWGRYCSGWVIIIFVSLINQKRRQESHFLCKSGDNLTSGEIEIINLLWIVESFRCFLSFLKKLQWLELLGFMSVIELWAVGVERGGWSTEGEKGTLLAYGRGVEGGLKMKTLWSSTVDCRISGQLKNDEEERCWVVDLELLEDWK